MMTLLWTSCGGNPLVALFQWEQACACPGQPQGLPCKSSGDASTFRRAAVEYVTEVIHVGNQTHLCTMD